MKKRLISMIAAGGAAAAALALTTGPAQAASQPPQCQADAGACVAVTDGTRGQVHSISVNGQCASFTTVSTAITNRYFPQVTVDPSQTSPTTLTYSGYHCESNTQNSQPVGWFTGTGIGNYRWVNIGRVWM
jgi:Flp pilus assembly protein TadG